MAILCLLAAIGNRNNAAGQEIRGASTHLEFLTHAADSAFQRLTGGLMVEKNSPVLIKTAGNTEPVFNLLVQRFEHVLVNQGFLLAGSDSSASSTEVRIGINDLRLRYDGLRSRGLFGRRMMHRTLSFSLFLQTRDLPDRRLRASIDTTVTAENWFPADELTSIEENGYGLKAEGYPEQPLSAWAEFGVYLLTFTALSYLLYSVRSQ
ncbi:hypothetical protein JXO52_16600 [bacterium]|nr:hypothetical protein [bacterium]